MPHPLDNPVWHALTGPHAALAVGRGLARHYPRDAAPPGWQTVSARPITQMVAEAPPDAADAPDAGLAVHELDAGDATDMLALAEAADPGPFGPRSALLGSSVGARDPDGRLVAMAGERLRLPRFVELSTVCVHPEARGRGFGGALTVHLARRGLARGEAPFLHVFPDNPAAGLYARLGFRERARLWVVWRRPGDEAAP